MILHQLSNNKMHVLYFDHINEIFSKEDFDALQSRENEAGYPLKSFLE